MWLPEASILFAVRKFFQGAIATSGMTPRRAITDKAASYPPALAVAVPGVLHRTGRYRTTLHGLHAEVIGRFNRLAMGSYFEDHSNLASYTPRHRWRIARYHEQWVLEEFEFHISFATALPGIDGVDRLRRAIVDATGLFEMREQTAWTAEKLVLFERRPDGRWRMAEVFPLGG